jgi:hypothetical protein
MGMASRTRSHLTNKLSTLFFPYPAQMGVVKTIGVFKAIAKNTVEAGV